MARVRSEDYRDYVIKDGKFIGAFEEMYSNCADPWHQDAIQPLAEDLALFLLAKYQYNRVLDIGCGKGRLTARLKSAAPKMTALDISPIAVRIAQSRLPDVGFLVSSAPPLGFADETFDLVVCAELLWYVLPELGAFFEEIRRVLKPGSHLLIIQQFYKPEEQKYGREFMQTPGDLLNLLPFDVVHGIEVDRHANHKFVVLVKKST